MGVLDRHFLLEWLRYTLAALTVCLLLFLLADLFGLMDHFLDRAPSPFTVLLYFTYRLGYLIFFLLPLSVLIGGFWFLHALREREEWTIVLTAGVSPRRLLRLPLAVLAVLTPALVLYGAVLLPAVGERMEFTREIDIKGKSPPPSRFRNVHLRLRDGRVLTLGVFRPERARIRDVRVTRKRDNRIVERWDAAAGRYDPTSGWILRDVVVRRFRPSGQLVLQERTRRRLQLEPPGVLETVLRNDPRRQDRHPSRYRAGDLFTAIRFRTERGMNALPERVYLHWKLGFPLILPVLGLAGMLMGLYTSLGRTGGIGTSLLLGFGYWIVYGTVLALGQSASLQAHPWLATYGPLMAVYGPPLACLGGMVVFWGRQSS